MTAPTITPETTRQFTVEHFPGMELSGEGDDPKDLAHYVDQSKWNLIDAQVNNTTVTAVCGYTWVPGRDPKRFKVCRRCVEYLMAL